MDSTHSSGWSCCSTPGKIGYFAALTEDINASMERWGLFYPEMRFHHFGQKRRLQAHFVIDAVVPVVCVNLKKKHHLRRNRCHFKVGSSFAKKLLSCEALNRAIIVKLIFLLFLDLHRLNHPLAGGVDQLGKAWGMEKVQHDATFFFISPSSHLCVIIVLLILKN